MSLRSGSNQKRQVAQEQYNQERGFETFLQGANQQRLQQKKQSDKNDQRAMSKDRKKWQDLQDQAISKQNQQEQLQQQQQIKGDAQRQKWNKIPPSKEDQMKEAKTNKKQQKFDKTDGEQIMNYLQTMDKAELEMLRQSLIVQNNKNQKKGDQNWSPNKAMMVEEDEILQQYQYSQDDEYEQDDLDNYKEEGYDNIEEEIEENVGENQSELYQPNFNERSYHTQYQNSKKQISQKARPISAIQASSYTQNSQPSANLKNYESHRNFAAKDSRNQSDEKTNQREIVYNEETKQLNSNPFNTKSDGRRLSENFQKQNKKQTEDYSFQNEPVQVNKVNQQQRKKETQTIKNQDRDKDLEDIVMKLSKMNQGTRQELATLIDKIGNGELDVSAIKSLLFMQNNNSNQSINTNKSQSVKDQSQHGRVQSQNYQSQSNQKEKPPLQKVEQNKFRNQENIVNVESNFFGEEEAKPETIKFSRDQFSISLAKGLLQNTQELEKTLNLGNDDSNKQIQKVQFTDHQSNQQIKFKPQRVIETLEETQNDDKVQKQKKQAVTYQKQDENSRYQQSEQNYANKIDQSDLGKQQKPEMKIKEPNDSQDEYFDEDDLDDVPVNQNFYNKLNKNKLKDTLQLKNQKEQITQLSDQKKPNEEINSERSSKKQESKQSQDNKTYNLSKNKDKIQQIQLKDIKEQKGEVFIIIRVISTWGSAHLVGLTEIKVYDEDGCNIKLKPEDLLIEGGLQTSSRNIYRICDGVYDTIDSEHMWLGTMPDPPKCMEIGIKFKSSKGIGALRVWNYNKSLIDSVKGIKEIEITRNNNLIWVGQIKKGIGKESENYGDLIKFKEDIVLDDEKKVFRVSQQQGVIPTKVSANIPKDVKNNNKTEEKPPVSESISKLPQKKIIPPLQDDSEISKQGRQRGSNLNSQSSNTTPQASSRIRSAQQKPQPNLLSKDNDELDSQQQIQQKKSVIKDTEVDTLSKALQNKNQVQKSSSSISRTKNETTATSSNTSLTGQSKLVGASSFETSKNKLKLDDNKTPKSQTGSGKTTPSNALLNSINQTSTEPSIEPASSKLASKKGPKVLNVFDEKQKNQQLSSQTSLKDPYQNESPIQKRTTRVEYKEDKIDLNIEKSDLQVFKKSDLNQADQDLKDPKKKSSDESSSGKVDDFMENVKFFNATHQGRFQPAERERILQNQAQDVQQAVKQTLQSLNPFFQQNLGKKGIDDDIQFKSEDDSGDYSKIDVFMKQSTKLQQQLSASIQRNNQERQSQQSKLAKPILQDDDSLLDQILREENQSDEKDYQNQQKIFAPKSPKVQKANIFQENKQTEVSIQTQKQDVSTNLDDTHQFEKEMNKLLESKNSPFMGDILKSVQKENQQIQQQNLQTNSQQFQIPNLPEGKSIKIEIYTTWGDNYYVGLTGIEFFDSQGNLIQINNPKKQVKAEPSDINILPEYGEDPRTCDKLVDGVYLTCDDLHMWLAPYSQGKINYIYIDFLSVQKLSMIRIWNYNKSRIHSFRGARDIKILLDEVPIFAGPIQRAQGIQYYAPQDCEYVMFTDSESIIQQIENNDWLNRYQLTEIEEEQNVIDKMMQTQSLQRPTTGNNYNTDSQTSLSSQPRSQTGKDGRPITSAKAGTSQITNQQKGDDINKKLNTKANQIIEYQLNQGTQKSLKRGIKCQKIKIYILKSWEDKFYVGLTGIEVYDEYGQKIPLKVSQLKARPKDLNEISGYHGDQRTLDKLIDGVNLTTNEKHMWLVQLLEQPQNYLQIDFMEEKIISGIKIWNYNKQQNYNDCKSVDQYRGAKIISIVADDNIQITPQQGILLRKAPGRDLFDYGQMIALPFESGWTQEVIQSLQLPTQVNSQIIQEYDTLYLPRGFCFRFNIHSTWGDAHYCGLNGIEFYDSFGNPIIQKRLAEFKLGAEPASVNILPGCQGDIRTIDKLVNCQNDTFDDRNMWLAPFINSRSDKNIICPHLKINTIYLFFEKPVIISAINFWNYSKTPSRGVREIEIFLDDKLLFRGYLKKAPSQEQHAKESVSLFNTVIFNRNQEILQKIKPVVYNEDRQQQNVIFSNEGKVEGGSKAQQLIQPQIQNDPSNHLVRPQTKVSGMKLMQ